MTTDVISFGKTTKYDGPEGYFKSLDPWSQTYRPGKDFNVEKIEQLTADDGTLPEGFKRYKAHMSGSIEVTKDDGTKFTTSAKGWTETFDLGSDNMIRHLTVDMAISQPAGH
jgi:hypothetical protein